MFTESCRNQCFSYQLPLLSSKEQPALSLIAFNSVINIHVPVSISDSESLKCLQYCNEPLLLKKPVSS